MDLATLGSRLVGQEMIRLTDDVLYNGLRLPVAVWHGVLDIPTDQVVTDSVKVLFVTAGWARFTCAGQNVPLRAGTIVVVPRHSPFSVSPVGFLQGVAIYLRPDFLEAHLRWLPLAHPLMQHLARVHDVDSHLGLLDVGEHGTRALRAKLGVLAALRDIPASEFAMLARVADVFDQVAFLISSNSATGGVSAASRPVIPRKPVVTAAHAIHEHIDRAWSVSDLARLAATSESQLTRLFRVELGTSPAAYLWAARADRMAELLAASDVTVSEASHAVGWGAVSASGRAFKRRYGMTPRAFVADVREPGPLSMEALLGRHP